MGVDGLPDVAAGVVGGHVVRGGDVAGVLVHDDPHVGGGALRQAVPAVADHRGEVNPLAANSRVTQGNIATTHPFSNITSVLLVCVVLKSRKALV